MNEEVEDIVGDVKYTDSQKSVATSNIYSPDFTDSSSDKHNSSGKETYVIECDDSDDSDHTFKLHRSQSVVQLKDKSAMPVFVNRDMYVQCDDINKINKSSIIRSIHCIDLSQESCTQTSKTIIELAEIDGAAKCLANKSLATQTSNEILKNQTIEYRIEVLSANTIFSKNEVINEANDGLINNTNYYNTSCNRESMEDDSSKFPASETDVERSIDNRSNSSNERILQIIDDGSKECMYSEELNDVQYENSEFDESLEEDSLMESKHHPNERHIESHETNSDTSEVPKSVDNDVEELYCKLSESLDLQSLDRSGEPDIRRFGTLTPLTEESTAKRDSILDITPNVQTIITSVRPTDNDILFTNNTGIKVKVLPRDVSKAEKDFKLPPIDLNQSCPNSPHLNYLYSINSSNRCINRSSTLPGLIEDQRDKFVSRWDMGSKDLAAGESPLLTGRSDPVRKSNDPLQLPPIRPGYQRKKSVKSKTEHLATPNTSKCDSPYANGNKAPLCIKERIQELKLIGKGVKPKYVMSHVSATESRSCSPGNLSSHGESGACEVAERGCDVLCTELLRRLRSSTWYDVADTLEELPSILDKYWGIITEQRIADLIRQVCCHVESPRTQVARSACNTLAAILKNTNYTKKPDFYEAVTILLSKTGSYSRPVRRAANVALDDIVCGVELSQAVTALCVHGVSHKSALVRCAAARLLVVCCALSGGGRDLLRARPPTAAGARRHALRSLAALLDDKNTDTRKYAERLYSMLRPLSNFEAYYLTDVDVELASRQMKKYDQLLLCGPPKETR